jgi:branched-chain amino acid transport system permease protein
LLATFAITYPIIGGLKSLLGTLVAVVFIQGFLIEGLRFLGDWRSLLFGAMILAILLIRPTGLISAPLSLQRLKPTKYELEKGQTSGARHA